MTDEEKEMKEWIEQRRKGSDLMSKLLLKNEELQKENAELKAEIENLKKTYRKQRNRRIDELQKENAELKEQISVLLSCSNCTENKGGYICEKEYNDKCLSQKIEHIKELQKENEELKEQIEKMKNDQKTAFIKGMRHFAKAMKKYDQTEGAWTDYLEHTVDTVLTMELAE